MPKPTTKPSPFPPGRFTSPHAAIIERFGGPVVLSELLGIDVTTVRHWRNRGIPAVYWPRIIGASKERRLRVTLRHLADGAPRNGLARGGTYAAPKQTQAGEQTNGT